MTIAVNPTDEEKCVTASYGALQADAVVPTVRERLHVIQWVLARPSFSVICYLIQGLGFRVLIRSIGSCPHVLEVYNRGKIFRAIQKHVSYTYPTVPGWGLYPSHTA